MSRLKSFDFYSPVLSTDIIKLTDQTQNNSTSEIPEDLSQQTPNDQTIKKKKKNKKNKNKTIQQQQQDLLKAINIKIPETQEDVDAWIAERKKRFPTRKRVELKEQVHQDREERGALDLSKNPNKEKKKLIKGHNDPNKPLEMPTNKPTKIPSILDKITEDEERKKYSIVLQCFRYFVKHNFMQDKFDLNQNSDNGSYYSSEYYSDSENNNND